MNNKINKKICKYISAKDLWGILMSKIISKIGSFIKQEVVLSIAIVFAIITFRTN